MNANACTHAWRWQAEHADNPPPMSGYLHGPLGLMLGLSLAIHLLALIWLSLLPQPVPVTFPSADLAIHLQYGQAKTASQTSRPALKPVIVAASRPVPVPSLIRTKPVKARQPIIKPEIAVKPAQTEPAETAKIQKTTLTAPHASPAARHKLTEKPSAARFNLSRVISRVQQDLKQYFHYPRLARRKDIQGTVILGFAINLRGTLINIHVVKSSGFAILDMAAEDALLKLHHLDGYEGWQADNHFLELPVIYRLTES